MNDFDKLQRKDFLKKSISEMTRELNVINSYFENKKKLKTVLKHGRKNGERPLLGLYNKTVYHPTAYCELKCVYLLSRDMTAKECYSKHCRHLTVLNKNQQKKGIKNKPMKYFDVECKDIN